MLLKSLAKWLIISKRLCSIQLLAVAPQNQKMPLRLLYVLSDGVEFIQVVAKQAINQAVSRETEVNPLNASSANSIDKAASTQSDFISHLRKY